MSREIKSLGVNTKKGNIVGVQPFMQPNDYASQENFISALDKYIIEAQQNGFIDEQTLMVFPEYIGSWFAFTGMRENLDSYKNVAEMVNEIVGNQLVDFGAAFRRKSEPMASLYQDSFSFLARKYRTTIVAGSILLSDPCVSGGILRTRGESLYNISATFLSDGRIHPNLVKKIFLVPMEITFVEPGNLNDLQPFDILGCRIGTAICADSWHPEVFSKLDEEKTDYVVVPSYEYEKGIWDKPWKGYSTEKPDDYEDSDVGTITAGQAWEKYALATRIKRTEAKGGVNIFLKGNLWDMGTDSGHSIAILGSEKAELSSETDGLLNMWLK